MQSQQNSNHGRSLSGNRGAANRPNQEYFNYSDDENREDADQTAFETPFHSFVTSNEDDEVTSSRRSNMRKISSSTTSSQSSANDYVQIPTIGSTTTPIVHRTGLLSQGILRDAENLNDVLDDLSLSSNQITDPNDLTPTMDVVSKKPTNSNARHQYAESNNRIESPLSNDAIIRAKQLVDRASQLNEQIQPKK